MLLTKGDRAVSGLAGNLSEGSARLFSPHLGLLHRSGLIEGHADGKHRIYALTDLGWFLLHAAEMLTE